MSSERPDLTICLILSSSSLPPRSHLVQQLLVLCISSPNAATAASTGLISKRRKRLNATAFSQIVIDASTIADVNAFLHRWLLSSPTSSSFASHLLAALPPFDHTDEDADETIVARRRVRRSSHSSGASEEQGSPIVEAVGEVVKDADNVWGMLASAAAVPTTPQKSDKRRRKGSDADAAGKWNLLYDGQEDVEWSRDDADTSMAKLLTCLVQERDDNLSLVDEQFDSWRDLLDPMAPYDCEGVWRLLSILATAWKRQRQQVAAAEGSKSASALYDKLHLLKQIVSRPDVRKSYEDLATPLDVVFAGLTCLDHWKPWYNASTSKPPYNPAYAQAKAAAQHRHAETAALLLVELCHVASLGAISADALARGIFERLSFVGLPQIQALNAAFEQDQREAAGKAPGSYSAATSPKAILCDAYVRHLDLDAALEKGEKKDRRSAAGSHGPLLGEEDLREVFDEDDTLCMREVAGRALREHGNKESSSRACRSINEDEEDALEDEASLRLRLTACASSRASASVSPTISKKGGPNAQRRPSNEPSDDGRSGSDEDDAEQSQKLLEKALATASQALASLRRWEILAFVEKAYRHPTAMSDTSSSSTAKRLSSAGLQPTRLSAAFETTVQDVARDALDVLQEQHRRRRRSGHWSHGRGHSRRGSNVSNASSVSTAASGQSHGYGRAFSKTPSPLPESLAAGITAGSSTAAQQSARPKSGRTAKPPPRMGISRRSRGLSSSRSTATPAAQGQQQGMVSPVLDADDDEEDEETKTARRKVREAESREDWLLRVLLRDTVARLETLRGRMGAVQMGTSAAASGGGA